MAAQGQRIGNKNIMNRRQSMFKIKTLLPQIKQVQVKKNGQALRRMTVGRKFDYFPGIEVLDFN